MDWVQTIVIIVSFFGGFLYLLRENQDIRKEIQNIEKSLDNKIQGVERNLESKVLGVKRHLLAEIKSMDLKISNIEGQITQMTRPRIIPLEHLPKKDDPQEN